MMHGTLTVLVFLGIFAAAEAEAAACSALMCEDRTTEDAWGTGLYASPKYGDEGNQMLFGDDTVCGASKIAINGRPEQCYGTGEYPTNHFNAEEHCAAAGARLCTSDELQADEAHGSGCNYDFEWVWSSTACELTCSSGNTDTGYKVELGFSGAAPVGSDISRCLSPLTENVGVVRCCRDSCTSTRCTGYGACPEPEPSYEAESTTDACTYDSNGNVQNGMCECESANTAEACSSLGTSVGSQSGGGSNTCLVVDCGSKGLTFVPTIPTETTKLDLQNNPDLKELKGNCDNGDCAAFTGLDKLAWIYIQAVPLDELKPNTFLNFPALATLEISLTELIQIETAAFNLAGDALKTLTFADNNKLKQFQVGFFQDLSSLENVKFVNMKMYDLVQGGFRSMPNLKTFTARNCDGITGLPIDLFESSTQLESITLEYNFNLDYIALGAFSGASSVKTLRLIELQGLKSLEPSADIVATTGGGSVSLLRGLVGLTDLIIKSEKGGVAAISVNSFAGLYQLERVELKLADLTVVEPGVFRDATNLQKVVISGARGLMGLPSGLFDGVVRGSVQELVLAELGMSSLSPELFSGMQSMTSLEISCCMNLATLLANQFNLPNVEELAIANNPALENIEANAFAGCSKLMMLAVTNNPKLGSLVAGTFDHAFDKDSTSVVVNLAGNGFTFVSSRAINFDADGAPDQTIVVMSSAAGTSLEVCCAYEWMKLDRHFFTAGLQCTSAVPTNALIEGRERSQALPTDVEGGGGGTSSGDGEEEEGEGEGEGADAMLLYGSVMELSDPLTEFGCCFTEGWAVGVEYMHRQTVGTELGSVGSYGSLNGRTKEYLADFCANDQWNGATKLSDSVNNAYTNCTEGWANAGEGSEVALNCQPQLKDFFKTKFDPNLKTCIAGHCPSGSRLESIGRSYLLDCEPWLHADRSYATRHAVAEQHCVACIVANCKVCDENYRHCDECDAEHSLYIDPVTGVHSCVERTSCPVGFYSTDEHSTLVLDGGGADGGGGGADGVGADGNDDPTDMNLHECVAWAECGAGQKEESAATSMTDRVCTSKVSTAVIGGTVGGIVGFFVLLMIIMVVRHRNKVAGLKEELTKLGKTLVGVRHVKTPFSGRNVKLPTASAAKTATSRKVTKRVGANANAADMVVKSWASENGVQTRWYWQEGADRIDSHNKHDVLQPGNWVAYSWGICGELDQKYAEWKKGKNNGQIPLDLTNRIASTGTEAKAHGADTGVQFMMDFNKMHQMNVKSSFVRAVNRVELEAAVQEETSFLGSVEEGGGATEASEFTSIEMEWDESHDADSTIRKADSKGELPADLIGEDDKLLVMRVGQLVQQHNIRDDGWAFGTVLHNGDNDAATAAPQAGTDYETGWFPIKHTELASTEHLAKLQAALGEGALSALEPPVGWGKVRDAMVAERFELRPDSSEFRDISAFFKRTLHSSTVVVKVQRIQNMAMWQSYAMQRQIMAARDKKKAEEAEKRWLFHGTAADTVPKIIQQGFNRGFAGKNAVVYGRGVYFAKNASYSASTTYSPPDSKGVQSMFLVRVLTGFTCKGVNNQPIPDMRDASRNIPFDTTTNADKSIFVTYHDSQQYPEYLVQFK